MDKNSLETTDIFRGAFFLCSGGRLADVRLKEDARKIVSFLFEMEDIAQLDIVYRSGHASVNPLQFRESLNHLRDILFNALREKNPASSHPRRDYAAASGGTRYDRKREDRGNQAGR
ncbi:MAG: hypothetical protein SV375_19235 [Thermodesulfobacteriota bacterium]|nr:hypothetical protein [Thermodesulfobacteriota bacterium]